MKKKLLFEEDYSDFADFYDENKHIIYSEIVELFSEFQEVRIKTISLVVVAKIQNMDWNTEIKFDRKNIKILSNEILKYFESIDDYESCQKIVKLYNDLTI